MKIQSKYLVETSWLADHLDDPDLRIIDANAEMPNYFEKSAEQSIELISGRAQYLDSHIPGADFIDMLTELCAPSADHVAFPLPSNEQFAEAMSRHGISQGTRVVVYDRGVNLWSCRFWLVLRHFGFNNVAVLDGGWRKWSHEGRQTHNKIPTVQRARFTPGESTNLFATKADVIRAVDDESACLVNALSPQEFAGKDIIRYSRPGHIPTSKNIPSRTLIDLETSEFLDKEEIERLFAKAGVFGSDRVITYCGGAIGACSGTFLMSILGVENVALYNGSLREWSADPVLPMVTLDKVEE